MLFTLNLWTNITYYASKRSNQIILYILLFTSNIDSWQWNKYTVYMYGHSQVTTHKLTSVGTRMSKI